MLEVRLIHSMFSCLALLLLVGSCTQESVDEMTDDVYKEVASTAEEARPLMPGLMAPAFSVPASEGTLYDFDPSNLQRPVVLIFYRGGWCPWCNRQLSALRTAEQAILDMGYEMLFISADREEILRSSLKADDIKYVLLSDNEMQVARDYGVAFHVDDETVERYLNAGIDLEAASGYAHHILPVPAVFVIGSDGMIKFTYANPDYRVRVHPELLITAARLALE